jgi:iron complex outermembrane receptor protein
VIRAVALRWLVFALPLVAASVHAQEARPQRVEIVGSRVPRVDAETALPVQIIRRDEIERSGATNAEELLERVSANVGGFREAMGLGNADTPGFSGASLRGFGAGETLVLLNGRRLGNYAFTGPGGAGVDLHAIPLAAIDRVEVLKDGASALYGSDAIAGVINFVTRQDYAGAEAALGMRVSEAGGGGRRRATLALGGGKAQADGFNVFGVVDLQHNEGLRAIDRSFAATAYRPELGLDGTSPFAFPANIVFNNAFRAAINPTAPACTPNTVNKGRGCWYDTAKTLELASPSRQANVLGRATWRPDGDSDLYAELALAQSRVRFAIAPTTISRFTTIAGTPALLPASSPYYPTGLGLSGDLELAYRTEPLGPRVSEVNASNARLLAGARSRVAGWEVDGAIALNDSRARAGLVSGYVDGGRVIEAIGSGMVNPFGPSSLEGDALLAAAEVHGTSRRARGRTESADLRAGREVAALPAGPLALVAGAEVRREQLHDAELPIVGRLAGAGTSPPKDGRRQVSAVYAEAVAPLLQGVELQAAARWDHYGDFGGALSPKLALRVQPAKAWLLRASIGRGFRAPSLPELHTQQDRGTGFVNAPDPIRCPVTGRVSDCDPQAEFVSGGNPALRPQRSTQANVGLVIEPAASWQASVDVWSIRVRDIIGALNPDDVVNDLARYEGRNVIRGPVDPAFADLPGPIIGIRTTNENLGDWRVQGADLSVSLRPVALPLGSVSLRLDGTYVRRARQNIFEGNEVDLIGHLARMFHGSSAVRSSSPF